MVHLHPALGHQYIHRQRYAFAALCLGLSASLAAVTDAKADASIVVDASQTKSDCGSNCDDLLTLRNIFQGANISQEPSYDAMDQIVSTLNLKRLRLLQSDVYCDIDTDIDSAIHPNANFGTNYNNGKGVAKGDCYPLLWELQWAFKNHLSPHVPVATFMPPSFIQYVTGADGGGETFKTIPWANGTQLDRFRAYAQALVHYIVQESVANGAPSVVFEISNELDIADTTPVAPGGQQLTQNNISQATLLPLGPYGRFLWWIDPTTYSIQQWPTGGAIGGDQVFSYPYANSTALAYPYNDDVRRLDHGISVMHQIFANAIQQEISTDNPQIQIVLAGPAFADNSFYWNPAQGIPTLEEDFLDQMLKPAQSNCTSNPTCDGTLNARLDSFSFHFYGNQIIPSQGMPGLSFENITGTIKNKLQSLGKSQIPLFLSEWGPSNDFTSDVNYSHKGAAWAASFLLEALRDGVQMGSYLVLEDGLGFNADGNGGTFNHAIPSLMGKVVASDNTVSYYPKPAANVFNMFAMMTGTRRPATVSPTAGSSSNLGAFVTSDTSSAHVMVYNYSPQLVFSNPNNTDSPENVSVTIDNLPFNGNVTVTRYLVDSVTSNFEAFLADPTKTADLHGVETFTATVQNGQLTLTPHDSSGQVTTLGLGVTYWKVMFLPPKAPPAGG
jgi:hypothetical protein